MTHNDVVIDGEHIGLSRLDAHCKEFVEKLLPADVAHDITHIERVVKVAKKLADEEGANPWVVIAAAWLHDCVSVPKNHPDRSCASSMAAEKGVAFLKTLSFFPVQYLDDVAHAIIAHSFSANVKPETIEAQIVQDADRMDAIGAIGVARCMKVGGRLDRPLYHQEDPFCESREPEDLQYTLDHFFVKLLHIAESMCTESAKREANRRTEYMKGFLVQLSSEL
jgi:uncharacterized protein